MARYTFAGVALVLETDASGEPRRVLGTAFFVNSQGLFVTAKHIFSDPTSEDSGYMLVEVEEAQKVYRIRHALRAITDDKGDVAVGIVEPFVGEDGEPAHNIFLPATAELPRTGEPVLSVGYPYSIHIPALDDRPHGIFPERYSAQGVIEAHYPEGRDRKMLPGPCIQASFQTHPGSSGSPVLDRYGRVFGVLSTSFGEDGPSFLTPINLLYTAHFPWVAIAGREDQIPTIQECLPHGGNVSVAHMQTLYQEHPEQVHL